MIYILLWSVLISWNIDTQKTLNMEQVLILIWKKEKYMRRTAEGGQALFRIWIIFAAPLMGVQEARIFTGGIIRSCWRTMDCPI